MRKRLHGLMASRVGWVLVAAPILAIGTTAMGGASQAATVATATPAAPAAMASVAPNHVNNLDCNGYSSTYQALSPTGRMHCTDQSLRECFVRAENVGPISPFQRLL